MFIFKLFRNNSTELQSLPNTAVALRTK